MIAGLGTVVAMTGSYSKPNDDTIVPTTSRADPCKQSPDEVAISVQKAMALTSTNTEAELTACRDELKTMTTKHRAFVDACPTEMSNAVKHIEGLLASRNKPDCSALEASLNALKTEILDTTATIAKLQDAKSRLSAVYADPKHTTNCQSVLTAFGHLKNDVDTKVCDRVRADVGSIHALDTTAWSVHDLKDKIIELRNIVADPVQMACITDTVVVNTLNTKLRDDLENKLRDYMYVDLGSYDENTPIADLNKAKAELRKVIDDDALKKWYPDVINEYTNLESDMDQFIADATARVPP
jgi:hypothetical protein